MDVNQQKIEAATRALDFIRPGMRIGLGTGSTAAHFVAGLGARVRAGLDIVGVPTSEATRRQAQALGIPLTTLDEAAALDLTVDGADEIAPDLSLIKGGGGALLREKIVAGASARMIVIADDSKCVPALGRFPLPIEVATFGANATLRVIEARIARFAGQAACSLRLDSSGHPFVTDGGHFIVDAALRRIADPAALAAALEAIPGVVEHGLFIGMASLAIVADAHGVRIVERT